MVKTFNKPRLFYEISIFSLLIAPLSHLLTLILLGFTATTFNFDNNISRFNCKFFCISSIVATLSLYYVDFGFMSPLVCAVGASLTAGVGAVILAKGWFNKKKYALLAIIFLSILFLSLSTKVDNNKIGSSGIDSTVTLTSLQSTEDNIDTLIISKNPQPMVATFKHLDLSNIRSVKGLTINTQKNHSFEQLFSAIPQKQFKYNLIIVDIPFKYHTKLTLQHIISRYLSPNGIVVHNAAFKIHNSDFKSIILKNNPNMVISQLNGTTITNDIATLQERLKKQLKKSEENLYIEQMLPALLELTTQSYKTTIHSLFPTITNNFLIGLLVGYFVLRFLLSRYPAPLGHLEIFENVLATTLLFSYTILFLECEFIFSGFPPQILSLMLIALLLYGAQIHTWRWNLWQFLIFAITIALTHTYAIMLTLLGPILLAIAIIFTHGILGDLIVQRAYKLNPSITIVVTIFIALALSQMINIIMIPVVILLLLIPRLIRI